MQQGAPPSTCSWSTTRVDGADAFEYWRDAICDVFVQLAATPLASAPFAGSIQLRSVAECQLSTVTAGAQEVRRTARHIARADEEYLLASIQLRGQGLVVQDGRIAHLQPGSMAFYDSTRPYTLHLDGSFQQLVVQVPRRAVDVDVAARAVAVALHRDDPSRLVSDFFVGLSRSGSPAPVELRLVPHALGLLDVALGLAAGTGAEGDDDAEPARSGAMSTAQVLAAVRSAAADPLLDADAVAAACGVSRRTLFRLLSAAQTTFTAVLRAERVRRASALLRSRPDLPLALVAHRAGFLGEAQLHRAFRRERGTTPGAVRAGDTLAG